MCVDSCPKIYFGLSEVLVSETEMSDIAAKDSWQVT